MCVTEHRARWAAFVGLALWTVAHVLWIFRTEVNWDEFALLARAYESLAEGELQTGGRPGLSTLILMPVVAGCENTLATVQQARLLWTPFSLGILIGFWLLLARLFEDRPHRLRDTLVGVALLALLPVFLKFSIQVRTDQPAIAFGLLGGVALLTSRYTPVYALLSGLLLGLGYLSSQKLVYVAALVGLLATADVLIRDRVRWRRDLTRLALMIGGGLFTLLVFRSVIGSIAEPPGGLDVGGQMNVFAHYRRTIGYSHYLQLLPGLAVPIGLTLLTLGAAWGTVTSRHRDWAWGVLAFAVFALGLAVGIFHAGAFPYFWLTLGLFPATAVACGMPLLRQAIQQPHRRRLYVFLGAAFLTTVVTDASALSEDGQALQRATENFVAANFHESAPGFHTTRALFCRTEPSFPTYFSQSIYFRFMTGSEAQRDEQIDEFIQEFSEREVAFIVRTFRVDQFPDRIRRFWYSHYVPYWGPLLVPGIELSNFTSEVVNFEVIVPGAYVLHSSNGEVQLDIDGTTLSAGDSIYLERSSYRLRGADIPSGSMLTLALPAPPGPTTSRYYSGF